MSDPYNLERFVEAQERVADDVTRELEAGRKRTHWMWFVFPQVEGLGSSATAQRYAIGSLDEAIAYLNHPVLGPRLEKWTQLVVETEGRSADEIFGYPDYLKFRSSMTLFDLAEKESAEEETDDGSDGVFRRALEKYYAGRADDKTLRILGRG